MKTLITLLILLTSFNALADCNAKLLDNYSKDSKYFSQYTDDVEGAYEVEFKKFAMNAAMKIMKKIGCQETINIETAKVTCIKNATPAGDLCNIEIQSGYFVIMQDYVDTTHIIFNRWD
jgi:hypothetical protein